MQMMFLPAALTGRLGNLWWPDSWKFLGEGMHCALLLCKLMRPVVQLVLPWMGHRI